MIEIPRNKRQSLTNISDLDIVDREVMPKIFFSDDSYCATINSFFNKEIAICAQTTNRKKESPRHNAATIRNQASYCAILTEFTTNRINAIEQMTNAWVHR